jgi:hypothetical protein
MRKILAILLIVVAVGLLGYRNSFAEPLAALRGNWILFADFGGNFVGQPKQLGVYYDKDSVKIFPNAEFPSVPPNQQLVALRIWFDDSGLFYVSLEKSKEGWFCRMARSLYRGGSTPPMPIPKGSVLHLLLKTLKHNIFNFMSLLCFAIFEMYLPLALAFAVLALFAFICSVVAAYYDANAYNDKNV